MVTPEDKAVYLQPSAGTVGIRNCCPRCGEGRLLTGVLTPARECANCGLDFGFVDSGDGPAVFVILIVGFLVTGLAMALQTAISPPIWVHMLLWTPLVIGLSVWGLRFAKAVMIALQYQTKAQEAELED